MVWNNNNLNFFSFEENFFIKKVFKLIKQYVKNKYLYLYLIFSIKWKYKYI